MVVLRVPALTVIAGVAQIVLNAADLDRTCRPYLDSGWRRTFRLERLPNHPAKAGLQAVARSALDMVHLVPPNGTAVEVTRYADGPPAGETVYELIEERVRAHVRHVDRSREFWRLLGFRAQERELLEFRAMLPAWRLQIELLRRRGSHPETSVDAEGCVLVTVLTTAIEPELNRLRASGLLLRCTPSWSERIGDRVVVVAVVEGPSGELVELLQVPREAG